MKLLVGLGNPGTQYVRTRHNYGFMVVDELATRHAATWSDESKFKAKIAKIKLKDQDVILVKPQTYMNESGQAVQAIAHFYKLESQDIWVLSDDLDLPFGVMRSRRGGGAGGHNGLRSIIAHVGDAFMRFRLGIGQNDHSHQPSEDYVLQGFPAAETEQLPQVLSRAADIVTQQLLQAEPESTTYTFNRRVKVWRPMRAPSTILLSN